MVPYHQHRHSPYSRFKIKKVYVSFYCCLMRKIWNCKLCFFVSGDGVCQATKYALALLKKKFGVQSTQRIYGRKIDLMFIDRKHKVELCSSEWKKRNISLETLLCQQTKKSSCLKMHF